MKTTVKNLILNLNECDDEKEVIILTLEDKEQATENKIIDFQESDNQLLIFTEKK